MGKNNINDIISSELVARTNNNRIRHEYGSLEDPNLNLDSLGRLTFQTQYEIVRVIAVTIRGVVQVQGVNFQVKDKGRIVFSVSNNLKNRLRPVVLVTYEFDKSKPILIDAKPYIEYFAVHPRAGKDQLITFSFAIKPQNGRDIRWSILKDGNAFPIIYGSNLLSSPEDAYELTAQEASERAGDTIPFTLVVTYNMMEEEEDEKLLASTEYRVFSAKPATGALMITPSSTNKEGDIDYTVNYTLDAGDSVAFLWKLEKVFEGQTTELANGDNTQLLGSVQETYSAKNGEKNSVDYVLYLKEKAVLWEEGDRATFTIDVPFVIVPGRAGYIGTDIMGTLVDPITDTDASVTMEEKWNRYSSRLGEDPFGLLSFDIPTLGSSLLPIATKPADILPDVDPVYLVIELNKYLAPNGIQVISSIGTDITSQYERIDDPNGDNYIYIYKHTSPLEFGALTADVSIKKL